MEKSAAVHVSQADAHDSLAAPPPAYNESQAPPSIQKDVKAPLTDIKSSTQSDSSDAEEGSASARTLKVRFTNWKMNGAEVLDKQTGAQLYNMKIHCRKPNLIVQSTSDPSKKSTVSFHSTTNRIDTVVNDQPLPLNAGCLRIDHHFNSLTQGGTKYKWKSHGLNMNLKCVDEHDNIVARVKFSKFSTKDQGTFDLFGTQASNGPFMEEVVITGLAMMEMIMTLRYTAAVSAANA